MKKEDEIYFETHEEELRVMYLDYLEENGLTEAEFSFAEFLKECF